MSEKTNCPYLIYKTSKSCASCTGYRCTSAGREKKVDEKQLETCRDVEEYVQCTRYIDTLPEQPIEEEHELTTSDSWFPVETIPEPDITLSTTEPEEEQIETTTPEPPPVKVVPCHSCGGGDDIRASDCPYQGPAPEGMSSCLGIWCYANNKNIRVDKNCVHYEICPVFAMSKYKGVPYYDA